MSNDRSINPKLTDEELSLLINGWMQVFGVSVIGFDGVPSGEVWVIDRSTPALPHRGTLH